MCQVAPSLLFTHPYSARCFRTFCAEIPSSQRVIQRGCRTCDSLPSSFLFTSYALYFQQILTPAPQGAPQLHHGNCPRMIDGFRKFWQGDCPRRKILRKIFIYNALLTFPVNSSQQTHIPDTPLLSPQAGIPAKHPSPPCPSYGIAGKTG